MCQKSIRTLSAISLWQDNVFWHEIYFANDPKHRCVKLQWFEEYVNAMRNAVDVFLGLFILFLGEERDDTWTNPDLAN